MWCSVRVHTGGNRAKPPQARKARRPTTADRTSVLCITSAEFGGSGGPSLTSERMAGNYWNTFAPGATHLSSPTSATKSALVQQKVNVILAGGTPVVEAVKRATSAIPIVAAAVSDLAEL